MGRNDNALLTEKWRATERNFPGTRALFGKARQITTGFFSRNFSPNRFHVLPIINNCFPMSTILVVGGAGYIGSHMVKHLADAGEDVIVLDNLSTGYRDAIGGTLLFEGDIGDEDILEVVFARRRIDVVMHFASFIQVAESIKDPAKYYRNNFSNTIQLLDAMVHHNVKRFVFSSAAVVYGIAPQNPIREDQPCAPVNPYGMTKWMVEEALHDYNTAYGLKSVSLRYFNAAGAHPTGTLGERHDPETHLIPLVLQVASGRRKAVEVFGRDYETKDGTCIRDYIHVCDLCDAHFLAMKHLTHEGESGTYNLGNGDGFSVQEVIDAARRVTGNPITVLDAPRRSGDSPMLVADSTRVRGAWGWTPCYSNLDTIIEHAWKWEQNKGSTW